MTDFDSPWKDLLDGYFERFMAFFFPEAWKDIDWEKHHEFLNSEFQQIARDTETGRRLVDRLVKVWRKDGVETWVLVHVEVQGRRDAKFAERMYVYHYRIYDRYHRKVASLAVLADKSDTWRPNHFGYSMWGCEVDIKFPIVKLLDYENEGAIPPSQRSNPFAIATIAHLKANQTKGNARNRLNWKTELVKNLYELQYSRKEILDLFRFIDWIMDLPEKEERLFKEQLVLFEEEKHMQYVTSIERLGRLDGQKEGKKEGMLKISREAVSDVLRIRFKRIPKDVAGMIRSIEDINDLKMLHKFAITAPDIATFQAELEKRIPATIKSAA
jgi:hypothetical protein